MEEIEIKTFKDLDEAIKEIADKYFYAKRISSLKDSDFLAEVDYIDDHAYINYANKVEEAYLSLSEAERNLINNEFFFQSYHQWWKAIYSKATFYRFKRIAMQKFIGAFYAS